MEKWKGAPKASDYDLSVELGKLSTQMRAMRAAMINQRSFDRQTVKGATDMIRTSANTYLCICTRVMDLISVDVFQLGL